MGSTSLSEDDVERFDREGFVNRIPILSPDEARGYLGRLEAIEAEQEARLGGEWWPRDYRPWEDDDHPAWELARELATLPALLDAVSAILGPDLLVRNADVFIKVPGVPHGISWHRDTAERGPDADRILTAWLGLTASNERNGCMQFSAGSHLLELPDPPADKHHLALTPRAVEALDSISKRSNRMDAGMLSLHHFLTVHRSGPNRSSARRVGFVVRFMSPAISRATAESGVACLVRGRDRHGSFQLRERFPMTWKM